MRAPSASLRPRDRLFAQATILAQVFRPTLRHLADRVATRLRAKSRPGRTVTVRVRFADMHSVTRSVTLDAPISATAILAEIAEELVRVALADHPNERTVSLLAISLFILSGTGNCSSNFHLDLKMKNAGQAPGEGWRVGRQTALLT